MTSEAMREAFAAKYKSDPNDPMCAEMLEHFADGWEAARAGSEVKMPVVAYLRATKDGEPQWSEDCVCQDPVYPADPDGSDGDSISMPMVRQSDALAAIEAARVEARAKALEEAAKECERMRHMSAGFETGNTCAEAIRSLAKEAP